MPFLPSSRRRRRIVGERKRKKGREIRRESRKKVSRTNAPPPPPCIAWLQAFLRACYVRGEMWSPNRRKKEEGGPSSVQRVPFFPLPSTLSSIRRPRSSFLLFFGRRTAVEFFSDADGRFRRREKRRKTLAQDDARREEAQQRRYRLLPAILTHTKEGGEERFCTWMERERKRDSLSLLWFFPSSRLVFQGPAAPAPPPFPQPTHCPHVCRE